MSVKDKKSLLSSVAWRIMLGQWNECGIRVVGAGLAIENLFGKLTGNLQDMKIGVLALQGTFIEHINTLRLLDVEAPPVRLPRDLDTLDALVIPGGESTTMLSLMESFELIQPVREMARNGLPVWGTCAGVVLLAKDISNDEMETLGLMDTKVRRNAFGSQVDSFEVDLRIPLVGEEPFHAVFIRAPIIEEAKPEVEILSRLPDGTIVAVKQGRLLACAFHPEFTDDLRFHSYFLNMVSRRAAGNPGSRVLRHGRNVS